MTEYRVRAIPKPPFVVYDSERNLWSGMLYDLLHEMSHRLNFTYTIDMQEDQVYGHMDDNGTWCGLIAALAEKKVDIGLAAFGLMAERLSVIDMTDPVFEATGNSAIMLKPDPKAEFFRFVTVLQRDVWLCIFGSFLISSLLIWIFDTWSPYSYQNNKERYKDDLEKRVFTLKESLWFCLTSLTPQGGGATPKNLSGKLVAATWWLFGFIIVASYTANLAASLTVAKYEKRIESFEDLVEQYKYQYSVVKNSSTYRYFERMKGIEMQFYEKWKDMSLNDSFTPYERAQLAVWEYPLSDKYIKIYSSITEDMNGKPKMVGSFAEGLERVNNKSQPFALIAEATDVRYLTMTDCRYKELGPEFSKKPFALALQKDSPLTKEFNKVLVDMNSKERWLEGIKNKWWKDHPEAKWCVSDEERNSGVIYENIGGIFVLISGGILAAILSLIYEYFYFKYFREDYERFTDKHAARLKRYVEKKFKKLKLEEKIIALCEKYNNK